MPLQAETDPAPGRSTRGRLTVGAVVRQLGQEFPDLTISKLRFLEAEGLVRPERTAAGYRQYTGEDIERLRYVLTAQRDRFWPLKVIQESLDALDRGLIPPEAEASARPVPGPVDADQDLPTTRQLAPDRPVALTRAELLAATGLGSELLDDLADHGLLQVGPSGHFSREDAHVAQAAAGLAAYGIEPRHLRAFRTAADREVGLVEQALGPRHASGPLGASEEALDVARLCLQLHLGLVKARLADPSR